MYKNMFLILSTIIILNSQLLSNQKTVFSDWVEPRDSSTISILDNSTRSTADGEDTFGMSKELTGLTIGKEYTLTYSFLTGTSKNSFGRISENSKGSLDQYSLFENIGTNKSGSFTFIATQTRMYIAFLSNTD